MSESQTPIRRGLVLHALHAQYPMALTQGALDRQVSVFYAGDSKAQARDLAYLAERELLRREQTEVGGQVVVAFRITAKGVDIVERLVTDPGVEIASA